MRHRWGNVHPPAFYGNSLPLGWIPLQESLLALGSLETTLAKHDLLLKERLDKAVGIEGDQVFWLFSNADVADRQP